MRSIAEMIYPNGDPSESEPSGEADLVKSGISGAAAKSWFTDPFALMDSLGMGYRASPSTLSYHTLKAMAETNVIISGIIQVRTHQVASFSRPQQNKYSIGFRVAHKDKNKRLSPSEVRHVQKLENFIINCGWDYNVDRDSFETYVKKVVRDRLIYDQTCTEVVNTFGGRPHEFHAIPGSTIRLASPKHERGTPLSAGEVDSTVKYLQVVDNSVVNTYTPKELGFSVANPRTDLKAWGYGYSELEMLIRTVTAHLWAEEWNRKAFSQGSTTKGILNIKGNLPPQQLDAFKRQWLAQVSGVANAWRTPVINSQEDIQWISLQPTNNEMGYQAWMEYLVKIACSIYLMDPSELNFDVRGGVANAPMFMTTNEAQQKMSQDRGLRPLLRHVQDHINRNILRRLDDRYELEYVGIDAKTEAEAIELRLKELQSYKTLNEIRELEQLPPVKHGDIVPNPSYIGYRNQKEMMDQQGGQMMGGGPSPEEGVPGGEGGFPTAEDEGNFGADTDHLQQEIHAHTSKKKKKKKKHVRPRIVDRYDVGNEEPWESTYHASVDSCDLKKAMEPYSDLTGN